MAAVMLELYHRFYGFGTWDIGRDLQEDNEQQHQQAKKVSDWAKFFVSLRFYMNVEQLHKKLELVKQKNDNCENNYRAFDAVNEFLNKTKKQDD